MRGYDYFSSVNKVIKIRVYGFDECLGWVWCCVGVVVHVCGTGGYAGFKYLVDIMQVAKVLRR